MMLSLKYYFTLSMFLTHPRTSMIQGDPNQNPLIQKAITLKLSTSAEPHFGKAKMYLRGGSFFFEEL